MSTWAMIQPPKMSPLPLASAGIGIDAHGEMAVVRQLQRRDRRTRRARASSLEISGILLHLEPATRRFFHQTPLPPLLDATRRPLRAAAAPSRRAARRDRRSDWRTLAKLLPYVWAWRWRVLVALACLVAAKLANIGVPLVLKSMVDALALKPGDPRAAWSCRSRCCSPTALLRLSITLFTELREFVFYGARRGSRGGSRSRCSSTCTR